MIAPCIGNTCLLDQQRSAGLILQGGLGEKELAALWEGDVCDVCRVCSRRPLNSCRHCRPAHNRACCGLPGIASRLVFRYKLSPFQSGLPRLTFSPCLLQKLDWSSPSPPPPSPGAGHPGKRTHWSICLLTSPPVISRQSACFPWQAAVTDFIIPYASPSALAAFVQALQWYKGMQMVLWHLLSLPQSAMLG